MCDRSGRLIGRCGLVAKHSGRSVDDLAHPLPVFEAVAQFQQRVGLGRCVRVVLGVLGLESPGVTGPRHAMNLTGHAHPAERAPLRLPETLSTVTTPATATDPGIEPSG